MPAKFFNIEGRVGATQLMPFTLNCPDPAFHLHGEQSVGEECTRFQLTFLPSPNVICVLSRAFTSGVPGSPPFRLARRPTTKAWKYGARADSFAVCLQMKGQIVVAIYPFISGH